MNHWEYLVIEVQTSNLDNIQGRLNALGRERWELIAVASFNSTNVIYLKRDAVLAVYEGWTK